MSDKPLFEHMDEQEAEYAPQELPPGSPQARQARVDEGATGGIADEKDEEAPTEEAAVLGAAPGAEAGSGPDAGEMRSAGGIPPVGPAIAGEIFGEHSQEEAEEGRSA